MGLRYIQLPYTIRFAHDIEFKYNALMLEIIEIMNIYERHGLIM